MFRSYELFGQEVSEVFVVMYFDELINYRKECYDEIEERRFLDKMNISNSDYEAIYRNSIMEFREKVAVMGNELHRLSYLEAHNTGISESLLEKAHDMIYQAECEVSMLNRYISSTLAFFHKQYGYELII